MNNSPLTASLILTAWLICRGTNEASIAPACIESKNNRASGLTSPADGQSHPGLAEEMAKKKKKGKKHKSGASKSGGSKKSGGGSHPGEHEGPDHSDGAGDND